MSYAKRREDYYRKSRFEELGYSSKLKVTSDLSTGRFRSADYVYGGSARYARWNAMQQELSSPKDSQLIPIINLTLSGGIEPELAPEAEEVRFQSH